MFLIDQGAGRPTPARRPASPLAGAALLLAAVPLAGCTAPPAAPAHPVAAVSMPVATVPAGPSCSAAPASLVGPLLGVPVSTPSENDNGQVTVCSYPSGGNPTSVVVRFRSGIDADGFAAERTGLSASGQRVSEVDGVADQAYSASVTSTGTTLTTLAARRGTVEVLVTSPAGLDRERALVQHLLSAG